MNFSAYCALFIAVVVALAVGLPTEPGSELSGTESSNVMLGLDVHQGDTDGDANALVEETENEHMPPPGLDVTPDEAMPDMPVQDSVMVNTNTKISTENYYVPSAPISGGQDLSNANTAHIVQQEANAVEPQGAVTAAAEAAGQVQAAVATHPGIQAAKASGGKAGGSHTTPSKKAANSKKAEAKKSAAGRTMGMSVATVGLAVFVAVAGAM